MCHDFFTHKATTKPDYIVLFSIVSTVYNYLSNPH